MKRECRLYKIPCSSEKLLTAESMLRVFWLITKLNHSVKPYALTLDNCHFQILCSRINHIWIRIWHPKQQPWLLRETLLETLYLTCSYASKQKFVRDLVAIEWQHKFVTIIINYMLDPYSCKALSVSRTKVFSNISVHRYMIN